MLPEDFPLYFAGYLMVEVLVLLVVVFLTRNK